MPLKTRLSLVVSTAIVAVCAIVSAVYVSWEWRERGVDMAEHVSWMAASASLMSGNAVVSGDNKTLSNIVQTVLGAEDSRGTLYEEGFVGFAEVLDPDGRPLVSEVIGLDISDRSVMESKRREAAAGLGPLAWEANTGDGCTLYGATSPVTRGGRTVGHVSVGVCDEPARHEVNSIIRDSVFLMLAAGLFGMLVGRRISGWFAGPVAELVKGAGELSSGNLDYRVETDSYGEMQVLASSFNTMAWSLREKVRGLEESRKEALDLSERLAESYEEARLTSEKLEKMNEWSTDMAFSLEEANKRLKEEMVQTETIVHSIKDGIVALDRDENIILMNAEAEELFGIRSEDARGENVRLLVDRLVDRVEEPEAFLSKFMAATASPDVESEFGITVVRPYKRVLRRRSSAIRKDDGEPIGRVVTLVDITRQKEVDDMKTNFVSTVSHELRTPLTSIKGALTLLRDAAWEDRETRAEFLSIAEHNTDRLIGLITNLLDLSRMDAGMATLNLARFDLNELVRALVRSSGIVAARDGVRIEAEYYQGGTEVLADREKIEQAVANLLDNAAKFSPSGGRVRVVTGVDDDELTLSVEDEGPGIPPDKLEKVFDKFYQLDMTATRKVGGSGLGLAICRAVIDEHGGGVRAVSPLKEGGGGTRFEVRLPRAGVYARAGAQARTGSQPALKEAAAHTVSGSRDKILIVDDDPAILKLQKGTFEREGFRVLTARTGKEALMIAREHLPGFIFLDVHLPDLDGITVAGILKRDPATRDIPIVFATGYFEEENMRILELGTAVIKKPFEEKELISAIRNYYG